jgi:hypothetical protein
MVKETVKLSDPDNISPNQTIELSDPENISPCQPIPESSPTTSTISSISTDLTAKKLSMVKETIELFEPDNISPCQTIELSDPGNISLCQTISESNDTLPRSSTRSKKAPRTMTDDFLWYKQANLDHQ